MEEGLPKGLAITVDNKPLIHRQLAVFRNFKMPVVISFSNQKSVKRFSKLVKNGVLPSSEYYIDNHSYNQKNKVIDVLRTSGPHRPWASNFDYVFMSAEDAYYGIEHMQEMITFYERTGYNVLTVFQSEDYMLTAKTHPKFAYDDNSTLAEVSDSEYTLHELFSSAPMLLTKAALDFYLALPEYTYPSAFIRKALSSGHRFKVLKPDKFININWPEDYERLLTFSGDRSNSGT